MKFPLPESPKSTKQYLTALGARHNIKFIQELGAGSFSRVYAVNHEENWAAVKVIKGQGKLRTQSEIKILKKLGHHHNIVRLLEGVCDENDQFIMLDLIVGGNLEMFRGNPQSESLSRHFIVQ